MVRVDGVLRLRIQPVKHRERALRFAHAQVREQAAPQGGDLGSSSRESPLDAQDSKRVTSIVLSMHCFQ